MKVPLAFVFSLAIVAQAGKPPDHWPALVICMNAGPGSGFPETRAEDLASKIFRAIGIALDWHHGEHGCKLPAETTIHIDMSTATREDKFPGALAVARLGDAAHHIEVFYDRIRATVEPPLVPSLLAHVLAHEITHILEGLNRHSEQGIMKAHWNELDYREMSYQLLAFAAEDIDLLHRQIGTSETADNRLAHGRSVSGLRSGGGSISFAPPAASPSSSASIVP